MTGKNKGVLPIKWKTGGSNYNMSRFIVSAADEPTCSFGHGSSGEGDRLAKDIIISPQSQGLRGSPSPAVVRAGGNLVGRGIANPMSERTRGFEILYSVRCFGYPKRKIGRNSHSPR